MANGKTRLINLLGKPLKVYRNEDDGSYTLFPVHQRYGVSDAQQEEAESVQIDEFTIQANIMEIAVPAPEKNTVFIVPEYVAITQKRNDLVAPVNLREDQNGKAFWCDGLSYYHMSTVDAITDSQPVAEKVEPNNTAPQSAGHKPPVL